jgi:hypothetical protein
MITLLKGQNILYFEKNEFILLLMMYFKSPLMKIGCLKCLLISKIPFVLYFQNQKIFLNLHNQIYINLVIFGF